MVWKIKAKLVLQLRAEGLSGQVTAASQGMSRKNITAVLEAADAAGVAGLMSPSAPMLRCMRCLPGPGRA